MSFVKLGRKQTNTNKQTHQQTGQKQYVPQYRGLTYKKSNTNLEDQYIQNWYASVRETSKLEYYCQFKTSFCFEKYLDVIQNDLVRKQLSRFRLSSHSLEIEVGRYHGTARENRICKLCNGNMIESEYHFMLSCPFYRNIRNKYLRSTSWPSQRRFISLMSSQNKMSIINCAKYIKEANTLRKFTLENVL